MLPDWQQSDTIVNFTPACMCCHVVSYKSNMHVDGSGTAGGRRGCHQSGMKPASSGMGLSALVSGDEGA